MMIRRALPVLALAMLFFASLLHPSRGAAPLPPLALDIRDFGAVAGDRSLVTVNNHVGSGREFPVTRQTRTGVALQQAIEAAGRAGGGVVLIPPGAWYLYSYVVVGLPNVEIRGQGAGSVLKACPDAPATHGYGLLQLGFYGKGQPEGGFTGLAVRDLALDGNIAQRGKPTGEFQMYNLALYGDVMRARIQNVTSIDSGIDCLLLCYGNTDDSGVVISDCRFKGAFRNTASFVSGSHVKVRDCVFEDGGAPFGGTNPRYCLDIEPDDPSGVIRHVQISGCTFRNARNMAVGGVWCQDVRFEDCLFAAGPNTAQGILFGASYCDMTVCNSTFDGAAFPGCYLRQESIYGAGQATPRDLLLRKMGLENRLLLEGNRFNRVGGEIQGHTAIIRNNTFMNAGKALFVMAPFAVVEHNLLTNCGWADPNGGRFAALCIGYNTDKQRRCLVADNLVRFNEDYLDEGMLAEINPAEYFGFYIQEINAEIQLVNNRAEGFFRFPVVKGGQQNANSFRDWNVPNAPPDDARTPTRVTAGNTQGGPGWQKETPFR